MFLGTTGSARAYGEHFATTGGRRRQLGRIEGDLRMIATCATRGPVHPISPPGGVRLREANRSWLEARRAIDAPLDPDRLRRQWPWSAPFIDRVEQIVGFPLHPRRSRAASLTPGFKVAVSTPGAACAPG